MYPVGDKYTFSIVMAVYNSAAYLEISVGSLLEQDLGFKENVQLILVDDGSSDGSAELCDSYREKYPDNILVIHKEHSGIAATRNEGLHHVRGKYINFMDSDDKLSPNALSEVAGFFEAHDSEVDMVSIPLYFMGTEHGAHPLNNKYRSGSRVIDLGIEYNMVQTSCSSAFIKADVAKELRFDERLSYAEDSKACMEILMGKGTLGVVSEAKYYYRRGIARKFNKEEAWFLPVVRYFAEDIFRQAQERLGQIPRFVQYSVMYIMHRRYKQKYEVLLRVYSEEEAAEYISRCWGVLEKFDDDVILCHEQLQSEFRCFLLAKKHHVRPSLMQAKGDIGIQSGEHFIAFLSEYPVRLEFLQLKEDRLRVEGYAVFLGVEEGDDIRVFLWTPQGERIPCRLSLPWLVHQESLGETVAMAIRFVGEVEDMGTRDHLDFRILTEVRGMPVERKNILLGKFFPLVKDWDKFFAQMGEWSAWNRGNKILMKRTGGIRQEIQRLKYFWKKKDSYGRKAVFYRLLKYVARPFFPKEIWLVSDRVNKADDNGEALFKYLHDTGKQEGAYFVIRKDSPSYEALSKYGNVVDYLSWKHLLLFLMADFVISSQANDSVVNPFFENRKYYKDIIADKKIVFLQHGITKDDQSSWLNRYNRNLALFVTAAVPEYESVLEGNYSYGPDVAKLTGMPRYDLLENRDQKIITVMPTWRQSLAMDGNYLIDGMKHYDEGFRSSQFFQFYNALLNDVSLLEAAQSNGYRIRFMPHPMMLEAVKYFDRKDAVEFCAPETSYREIFATSSLIVTDYSSVAFDFAYLEKPVIYAQFDKEEFFAMHTYDKGYFEYERDGFGEVEYDLEGTVRRVIEYMEDDCKLKEKYRERIEKFFAYHDRENCQRVYEAIKGLV